MSSEATGRTEINGRKWYSTDKIVWGLFAVVLAIVMSVSGVLWGVAQDNSQVNARQETEIKTLHTTVTIELRNTKEKLSEIRTEQMQQRTILEQIRGN